MSSGDRALLERALRARLAGREVGAPDRKPQGATRSAPGTSAEVADRYRRHVNEHLHELLAALDLDRTYVRGHGIELEDSAGRRCLDFAGAYGALPLGHNPDVVWQALDQVRSDGEPSFIQPSVPAAATDLASALAAVAPPGLTRVTFANSGAESIEAAIKLARAATGRLTVVSTHNSFHGKTLGALSATGNDAYQDGFGAPAGGFVRVDYADLDQMRRVVADSAPAAVLVEPIQGEGGVVVPPAGYLAGLRDLCDEHGVVFIVDEVQTGLGRTGPLFAVQAAEVVPDVITVAKALGGGAVPIAAVLSRPSLMTEHFALRHTSTFGGGSLACRVGQQVLRRLTDPRLRDNVEARSVQLRSGLEQIALDHPGVITAVRGEGLLLGVEFSDDISLGGRQSLVGSLAVSENLGMVVSSHLLARHGIRVAPTLFGNRVIRIEPPLTVTEAQCNDLLAAMRATVALVAAADTSALLGHLVGRSHQISHGRPTSTIPESVWRVPLPQESRFAFIAHPLDLDSLEDFDRTLSDWTGAERAELLRRVAAASSVLNPAPFLVGSGEVRSRRGASAHGELIAIPYTAEQLMTIPTDQAVAVVRQAVDLGVARGAQLVGLGAYSSIVTHNAVALGEVPVPVTTGNAFTAGASVQAVRRALQADGRAPAQVTIAVIGAGGAIGRAISLALAAESGRLLLVGRPGRPDSPRLLGTRDAVLAARTAAGHPADTVETGTDARAAAVRADVVITATSSPGTLLEATDLKRDAIVCDVAQPANVPISLSAQRPDVRHFDGGIVAMPGGLDFGLRHGLAPGLTYACMAETMVLALTEAEGESTTGLHSLGEALDPGAVARLAELAAEHGFTLAEATTWRGGER